MKAFISGERVDAEDAATADVLDSATQEFLDTIPVAAAEDVQRAIDAAQIGKRVRTATPVHGRSRILTKCADAIDARKEELTVSLFTEMGKIIHGVRDEIRVHTQIFRGFTEAVNRHYGKTMTDYQVGTENDMIFTQWKPLGVVARISPLNYPMELCSQKTTVALAAGNAVIIKPATGNPLTIMKTVELCLECDVPSNVLQLVTDGGAMVGDMLVNSDGINTVSLTDSTAVDRGIAKVGAETLKCIFLELGGNDSFIVFENAGMELAVADAVQGRAQNAGQTCYAPKRLLMQNSVKEEFIQRVIQRLENLKLGSPLDETTELGSLISPKAAREVKRQVDLTVVQGAELLYGGDLYDESYFEPTVLDQVTPKIKVACNMEIFGPVLPIIGFDTEEEAVRIANHTIFGLQAGVTSHDMKRAMRAASQLEYGDVVINGSGSYRHIDQPFDRWEMSGIGREGISATLDEMTQEKSHIPKNVLRA